MTANAVLLNPSMTANHLSTQYANALLLNPSMTANPLSTQFVNDSQLICMKCQVLFSRKNKKNSSEYYLLKSLPSMQSGLLKF